MPDNGFRYSAGALCIIFQSQPPFWNGSACAGKSTAKPRAAFGTRLIPLVYFSGPCLGFCLIMVLRAFLIKNKVAVSFLLLAYQQRTAGAYVSEPGQLAVLPDPRPTRR